MKRQNIQSLLSRCRSYYKYNKRYVPNILNILYERLLIFSILNILPEFLADAPEENIMAKFMRENIDLDMAQALRLVA